MNILYESKPMRVFRYIREAVRSHAGGRGSTCAASGPVGGAPSKETVGAPARGTCPPHGLAEASAYVWPPAATGSSSAKLHRATAALRPRSWLLGALALLLGSSGALAQQQFAGWCARVKIEIEQELTLERIGFEATLTVTNNDGEDAITDFFAELTFEDPERPGEDASDLFFVQPPTIESVSSVDGDGVIQPTRTAVVRWFIIPKIAAGGEDPRGKEYRVGCRLAGKLGGADIPEDNMIVIPATITVRPEPQLEITYFLPRDVQANNPFTETIESPVPFTLGVLVRNAGFGTARDLQIDSQQPRIVDNAQGLNLVAQLLGSRVQDSPLDRASLLVDLGDIEPGQTRKGAWDMITTLSGEFIDFNATYTHASELGGEETSVITSLDAHFFVQEVLNDQPGRDEILDFLAVTDRNEDLIPDALYESEGNVLPVNHLTQTEVVEGLDGTLEFVLGVNADFEGWGYIRIEDPAQGRYDIESVTRSDGREIHPRNAWTSLRYDEITNQRLDRFHIFDLVDVGQYYEYTVVFAAPEADTDPPETEIHFAGDFTRVGGTVYVTRDTQIYFMAEDDSPVSMFYKIDDEEDFRPALPFQLSEPGNYTITYFSRDAFGNEEAPKTQLVVLSDAPPGFDVFDTGDVQLVQAGDTLSVRPSEADLGFILGASPFPVEGTVDVFRGVVAWPQVSGVPPSPTSSDEATLFVGGTHADYYLYRLDGGAWSAERPVAEPIELSDLSGNVLVEIAARSRHGGYGPAGEGVAVIPEERILALEWTVSGGVPAFALGGMPPIPARETAAEIFVSAPGLELYRWTLDDSFFRPEEDPSVPIVLDNIPQGDRTLSLAGRVGGDWQDTASPSSLPFLADPMYGGDFSELSVVRTIALGEVSGPEVPLTWNGLGDDDRPVPSGWYTVRVTLSDDLGRESYRTRLVEVRNIAESPDLLAAAEVGPSRPSARGDWVVWQHREDGPWNIRARNLASGGTAVAVTSASRDQTRPHTDGRHVVWQGRSSSGTWDVWARDLADAGAVPVRLAEDASANNTRPVVDTPWVVWRERGVADADAPWQLVAHNMDTGETFAVHPGPADQGEAAIQSGRVVWRDQRDVGPGEIYFADLETKAVRRITQMTEGQFHPAVFGHWIVWQDTRHGVLDIYGYDFLRDAEVRLTDTPENEALPILDGYWMVTEEDGAGFGTGNFRLVNLEAGVSAPLTNAPTPKSHPGIAAGHFVWLEETAQGREIRAARLPAMQAVFADNNAVVVTEALVERFDTAYALLEAWAAEANVGAVGRYVSLAPEVERETAAWEGGAATGDDFPLEAGDWIWVRFDGARLVDLGGRETSPLDLAGGVNSIGYTAFPSGFRVSRMVEQLGAANVAAVRMLDSRSGRWMAVTVDDGRLVGPDFAIPETALLLVEMNAPVTGWTPE